MQGSELRRYVADEAAKLKARNAPLRGVGYALVPDAELPEVGAQVRSFRYTSELPDGYWRMWWVDGADSGYVLLPVHLVTDIEKICGRPEEQQWLGGYTLVKLGGNYLTDKPRYMLRRTNSFLETRKLSSERYSLGSLARYDLVVDYRLRECLLDMWNRFGNIHTIYVALALPDIRDALWRYSAKMAYWEHTFLLGYPVLINLKRNQQLTRIKTPLDLRADNYLPIISDKMTDEHAMHCYGYRENFVDDCLWAHLHGTPNVRYYQHSIFPHVDCVLEAYYGDWHHAHEPSKVKEIELFDTNTPGTAVMFITFQDVV